MKIIWSGGISLRAEFPEDALGRRDILRKKIPQLKLSPELRIGDSTVKIMPY
jgi:hypothetical protein